jgi:hypothetical protein
MGLTHLKQRGLLGSVAGNFVIRSSRRAAVDVSKRPGHSVAAEARVISDRTSVRVFAASALKKNLSFLFSFKTLTKDEICLAV